LQARSDDRSCLTVEGIADYATLDERRSNKYNSLRNTFLPRRHCRSHLENLCVAFLDDIPLRKDAIRILLHQLDIGEPADARFFHGLRVR